jgi:hypothetical protein
MKMNKVATVNPRYNGHVRFQRFCRYIKSAVVTIYRHYEVSHIRAIFFKLSYTNTNYM